MVFEIAQDFYRGLFLENKNDFLTRSVTLGFWGSQQTTATDNNAIARPEWLGGFWLITKCLFTYSMYADNVLFVYMTKLNQHNIFIYSI